MMEHLTETQLNEYLDGLMEAPIQAAVDAHLADCADCRERLASFQTVFQALDALPEEIPARDLTPSIIHALPRRNSLRIWQWVFAMQAGVCIGLLILLFPLIAGTIAKMMMGMMVGWPGRFVLPAVKFHSPLDLHFNLPVFHLPHTSIPALPILVTQADFSTWLILGIAASLLFIIGNFSLLFRSNSKGQK